MSAALALCEFVCALSYSDTFWIRWDLHRAATCEVVASADGASAHTAHCLSITQMSCMLTTIYCKCSVAAGACPTESMEVAETKSNSTHGAPNVPRHRTQNQRRLQHWIGEHNNQRTTDQSSSPSRIPISIVHSLRSIPFQSLYLQTTNLTQRSSPEGSLVNVPD